MGELIQIAPSENSALLYMAQRTPFPTLMRT